MSAERWRELLCSGIAAAAVYNGAAAEAICPDRYAVIDVLCTMDERSSQQCIFQQMHRSAWCVAAEVI